MPTDEPQVFDFSKPSGLPSESADALSAWLDACCGMFKELWGELAATERTFSAKFSESTSFAKLREKLNADSIVFKVFVGDSNMMTLLKIERPIAIAYALELIGAPCSELPEDRELSSIEDSLLTLFLQRFAEKFGAAWPKQEPIQSRLDERLPLPHRSRDYVPDETMLVHRIVGESGFGEHEFLWIAPHDELEELVAVPVTTPAVADEVSRQQIEAVATEIPIALSIELGSAEVPVADLPNLCVGDLIVLDQRIEEPIQIRIESEVKFTAWPGRKGNRHAAQIETIL